MADPLTSVADQVSPAPSNFFEPSQAQNIFARYATNRGVAAATEDTAKSAQNLSNLRRTQEQSQWERERQQRNRLLQTREDEMWNQKKEADALRGDFLATMGKELDPQDPQFNEKVIEFRSNMPPSLQKDDAVTSILGSLSRQADQAAAARTRSQEIEQRNEGMLQRQALRSDTAKYLTKDDWEKFTDANGEIDYFAAGSLANERKRKAELEDFGAKEQIKQKGKVELFEMKNMDAKQKARAAETKDFITQNTDAFPRRMDQVAEKLKEEKNLSIEPPEKLLKTAPGYTAAKEWDKDLFKNEVNAAMRYDTPEEYVGLVGGLDQFGEEARRRVWEYAHQNDAESPQTGESPSAEAPQTPQTEDTPATFQETEYQGRVYRRYPDGRILDVTP